MSASDQPKKENPGTYIVQNRANEEELMRVLIQDQMITAGMEGVLAEQNDVASIKQVLDVGCGTGHWLIEVAKTYPDMSGLVGVDISSRMIDYAHAQAEAQNVRNKVQFRVMDALRMLEFPEKSFDLVNQRFGNSYLRTWDWPKLLQEFHRMLRINGIVRLTESEMLIQNTSPALTRLFQIALHAAYRAGHFFTEKSDGVTGNLASLLSQYGFVEIQTHPYQITYRADTVEGQHFYEDMKRTFRTVLPFYQKWTRVPDDYEEIYQQALIDMQQPTFTATWNLLTVWGRKSIRE